VKKLTFFLFIFLAFTCFGQVQPRFRNISLLQGLSQSTVNCIIQDRQGFIWVGTQDGLNRYDGYSFKVYKHSQSNRSSLPDNYVQSLFIDSKGSIWIGTFGGGLSMLDPATDSFTNYGHNDNDPGSISGNQVMSIAEDASHNLWVGTSTGLNRLDPSKGTFKKYLHNDNDPASISSDKIRCIYVSSDGKLWIGTQDNGLNLFNNDKGAFTRFTADKSRPGTLSHSFVQAISETKDHKLLIGTSGGGVNIFDPLKGTAAVLASKQNKGAHYDDVWSVQEDSKGLIWFGTYGDGLVCYDPASQQFTDHRNDPTDNTSLGNNIVLCSFADRQGFIWIGTLGGGISYFDPKGSTFHNIRNHPANPNSINENVVMSVFEDEGKALYIGTYGGGLNVLDRGTGKISFYKTSAAAGSIAGNIVRTIFKDSEGRIWVGSYGGGLSEYRSGKFVNYLNDPAKQNSISANDVWCISEDKNGYLWIGTWGGGLNRMNKRTGEFICYRKTNSPSSLANDKVISLLIDSKGKIWAGTNGGGLDLLDTLTGTFRHFRYNEKDSTSLGSDRVRAIYEDKRGIIWLGTDGGGLCRMNADGTFQRFNEAHGLPNNVVYGILEDDSGRLWLSTNNGLCRLDMKTYAVRNFDVTDGIQGNEFNQGARFRGADGNMYFGGINGITVFNPGTMTTNRFVPPVVLTSVKLFGKELPSDTAKSYFRKIELSYDQNFFSFEFSALDYTAPEKNQYSCMMQGFDQDWIYLGSRRFVSYTNLDPGEYIFRIKASNNENVWNNEGLSIKVIVTPPFYRTKPFYVLLALIISGAIYLFIIARTRKLAHAKSLLEKEVSQRTIEIVKQKEIIEEKNKDITDSINYARRIQQALFPSAELFANAFPQSFILYRPKDIVSGDFYWMEKFGDDVFVSVVDCTGHGVPGAFMSIVGNNLLNQAVNELGISRPSLILDQMNKGLAKLVRNPGDFEFKDGMDMALCAFNMKAGRMQFAGANNPVWIIRDNGGVPELIEYRGDKKPIGSFATAKNALFSNHEVSLQKGDVVYLFSDGYVDQFGGEKGKKIKKSGLKELLLRIHGKSMSEQKQLVEDHLDKWRGEYEQVDDILVIGIRYL
jgi:ligand-binding sensor domain-containing protein/serine phosphatase RsbU (regulator of sigma subunit)